MRTPPSRRPIPPYIGGKVTGFGRRPRATTMSDNQKEISPTPQTAATFAIGDVVRHRLFPFRGVIFDVDPVFNNTEEWWNSIPEGVRPRKDQPFYHLLAENDESAYVAYVSQQNLIIDSDGEPVQHPAVKQMFTGFEDGRYRMRPEIRN
jgi:heat shock protein HspQ